MDATDAESTISLIMGASAVDLCDGEQSCVDGRANAFQTRTVLVEAVESEQSTQLDKLNSAPCHVHVVFCANELALVHARVSATECTASGIQQ
jgi:hypothetical protein